MQEMTIDSIRVSPMNYQRVVILKEKDADRYLPIWIGPAEADAIAVKLQDLSVPRPLTHDLLSTIIDELGGSVQHILVSDLHNDTFYAKITIQSNGTSEKTRELERSIAHERVTSILNPLVESSEDLPEMNRFLSQVYEQVMENLYLFKGSETPTAPNVMGPMPPLGNPALTLNPFLPFEINVLVDNGTVAEYSITRAAPSASNANKFSSEQVRQMNEQYASRFSSVNSTR